MSLTDDRACVTGESRPDFPTEAQFAVWRDGVYPDEAPELDPLTYYGPDPEDMAAAAAMFAHARSDDDAIGEGEAEFTDPANDLTGTWAGGDLTWPW